MRALLPALLLAGCGLDYDINEKTDNPVDSSAPLAPDILVEPLVVDFGAYEQGAPERSEVVYISNSGGANLEVLGLALDDATGPFTVSAVDNAVLPPTLSTRFVVTLSTSTEGPVRAEVLIDSNDPDEPTVRVELIAEGLPVEEPIDDSGIVEEPEVCACPEGFEPRPDDDGCERLTEVPATWSGDPKQICAIAPYFAYGMSGARYPGGSNTRDSYWGTNDGLSNGRLNASGVWACDANGQTASSAPVGEWIGVAVCLEIDEPADYLVGMGADNRLRLLVDGVQVMEQNDGSTAAFNYWWMEPVALSSGTHLMELWGKNDGSIAGFGAEVAGPFTSGSLVDDASMQAADYANNILFSTANLPGSSFVLGERSGWSCPDGSTYNVCDEEPECVTLESADCIE